MVILNECAFISTIDLIKKKREPDIVVKGVVESLNKNKGEYSLERESVMRRVYGRNCG